jgi:guanine deaminase
MKLYRASVLSFDTTQPQQASPVFEADGAVLVGVPTHTSANGAATATNTAGVEQFLDVGPWATLRERYPQVPVHDYSGCLLAPGFVDLHVHYPQTDVIGSPADGLLPWLEQYTFPHESRFNQADYAGQVAEVFLDELQRHGVTTALIFATSHPESVDALMQQASQRGLRLIAGKVLQDRHSPDGVRDDTEQSLVDTEALINRWHEHGRLGYAITPRFAPSCTDAQMRGAGELAQRYPSVWVQSHVAENLDEVRWVQELYPQARSYLSVYDSFGLLRPRAVYAHCIYLDAQDRALMRDTGTVAAVSPTSNLFLGSGFFDYAAADEAGHLYGLASDVGGGTSFSPFATMLAAYYVGRANVNGGGHAKRGLSLKPSHLWWQHTVGAAQALGLQGVVGNVAIGCEADFVIINPKAKPLLARKWQQAQSLEEALFALIVLGDDRNLECVHVAQK